MKSSNTVTVDRMLMGAIYIYEVVRCPARVDGHKIIEGQTAFIGTRSMPPTAAS